MSRIAPGRTASWIAIGIACLGIVLGNLWLGEDQGAGGETDDTTRLILLRLQGKVLVGAATLQPDAAREQLGALDAEAVTPRLARALAALHAEIDDPATRPSSAALDLLERHRDELDTPSELALHDIVERAVRDPAGLSDDDRELLRVRMGWFGRLLLVHAAPDDDPERRELLAESFGALALVGVVFAAGAGGVLVGIVLWIVVAVRRREGALRPAFRPPAEYGPWYLQAFALYVGLFFLLQIVPALLEPAVAGPIAFVGLVVASALGVLWPVIRGVPVAAARADLGIHRGRGVLREVASGVVGYVAILPIFAGGFAVTLVLMMLWEALNPSGEPGGPMSHPIVPMMAEGGTAIRIAVLLLASGFAPLFEEVLFRGALFADLRRFLGPAGAGLLIGVLFAAIHPQGLLTIPALGALAFGFALLREWRGSLIASIVAHALHNGALVAIMWLLLGS